MIQNSAETNKNSKFKRNNKQKIEFVIFLFVCFRFLSGLGELFYLPTELSAVVLIQFFDYVL